MSRYLKLLLLTTGVFVASAFLVNLVVDPFRYYHAPWLEIGYSDNQRYQNPGLARTAEYGAVLIGTSHTEPFAASRLGQALGEETLNLSMAGSLIAEQSLMAELVLEEGKARRILWEISYASFSLRDRISEPDSFPHFLFEPDAETPFRYLVSWDTFIESIDALRGQRPSDIDLMHRWDLAATFGPDQVLAHWDFMSRRWNDDLRAYYARYASREQDIGRMLLEYVGRLASRYPEVRFDLLLLPATLLEYGNDLQVAHKRLDRRLLLRDETARLARSAANVEAWDFQARPELADGSHYKDIDHFGPEIVEAILNGLERSEQGTPPERILENTRLISRRVISFMDGFCAEDATRCQPALITEKERFEAGDQR